MKLKKMHRLDRLSTFLRKKRIDMDISQRQLGKMLGFKNGQYVYDWENGRSNAPIGKMRELIKILELDPRQVIDIIQLDRLDFLKSYLLPKKRKTG